MASITAAAPLPVEIEDRLAALELAEVARRVARSAGVVRQAIDNLVARIENRTTEWALIHQVRKATAVRSYAEGLEKLAGIRRLAAQGGWSILPTPREGRDGTVLMATRAESNAGQEIAGENPAMANLPDPNQPVLFYVPGGGFLLPPTLRQRALARDLARAADCASVVGLHRLAPEHPFPIPASDLADHYAALLGNGTPASRIVVSGDSAGATLILSMLLVLRQRRLPMPAGVLLFSPWTDLALRGWSYVTKSLSSDSPFRMETAAFAARLYLGDTLPTDPRASPAYASLVDFPPMAIHCSRHDMHFDDAVGLAEQAHAASVPVRMNYWDSPRHHLERFRSRDAAKSIALAADFVRDRLRNAELH